MDDHELVSLWKFHYQRLKNEEGNNDDHEECHLIKPTPRRRRWRPWRKLMGRKRLRVRVFGLKKLLRRRKMRRKSRVLSAMKVSWKKALKKLKNNHQVYLNDLFGGNYLFMHVINP